MPDSLSALVGAAGTQPDAPAKKKLKKVGDHWEDDAGVKYADEAGTIALKMDVPPNEVQQAKAGAPAQSAMDAFGVEKSTQTGGWAPQGQSAMASGEGASTYTGEEGAAPQGMSEKDKQEALAAYDVHVVGTNRTAWLKRWMSMSEEDKKKYKALADQKRNQGA